jgi:guanyl-specific ribonuclease Sa
MTSLRKCVSPIGLLVLALLAGFFWVGTRPADATAASSISSCTLESLPPEATATVQLIQAGGPFPYPKNDGVVFDNREGILPAESSGYYHEYTVPTPGSPDRGARRIVTGSADQYYYTGDHYASFCQISDVPGDGGGSVPACASVPSQVNDTIALVAAGGPFPYPEDGEVYQNREGILPAESSNYYHLYTVPTPGTSGRGERRLVTGEGGQDYYTADNYGSFCAVS